MPLDWTNRREIAERLDGLYRETDLLSLTGSDIESMALEIGLVTAPPEPLHRENILRSVLWHWIRLRDESTQMRTG